MSAGAEVRAREPVLHWDAGGDTVAVKTSRDTYKARRLVITAGPWAANLISGLAALAVPERQVLLFTQPRHPERFRPDRFPIFIIEAPEGLFYGLPIYGVPGLKVGKYHHFHQHSGADAVDRDVHPEDERALRAVLARCFPDANGPTLAMKTCIFTNTPDEHFILDRLAHQPVCVAAGFSGHGYKFCSLIGEIMADLALDGGTKHDVSPFQLARFGSGEGGVKREN